jgi:hypothetical protein
MITGRSCVLRQPKTQSHKFGQLALGFVPVAQDKPNEIRAPWPRHASRRPSSTQAMAYTIFRPGWGFLRPGGAVPTSPCLLSTEFELVH